MTDLRDLGLSSYEEKAYRSLLARGPATARVISKASGVPMGRIYDVLGNLAARDLVRVDESAEPRRYAPVEPSTAVDRLLAARKEELAAERRRYERVADEVAEALAGSPPLESSFWTAGLGSDDARTYLREALATAEERVLLSACGPYEAAAWEAYAGEVEDVLAVADREVSVKLLLPPGLFETVPADVRRALLAANLAIRTTPELYATIAVVDDRAASVDVPDPFVEDERLGGVLVREESFVTRFAEAFERTWTGAEPVAGTD